MGLLLVGEDNLLKTLLFVARNNDTMATYMIVKFSEHEKEIIKNKFPELDFKKFDLANLNNFDGVVY